MSTAFEVWKKWNSMESSPLWILGPIAAACVCLLIAYWKDRSLRWAIVGFVFPLPTMFGLMIAKNRSERAKARANAKANARAHAKAKKAAAAAAAAAQAT